MGDGFPQVAPLYYINVENQFGWTGNGTTDDSVAWTNAIAAIPAGAYGIISAPSGGTSLISNQVAIPNTLAGITFDGNANTLTIKAGTTSALFKSGNGITTSNIVFRNIDFDLNGFACPAFISGGTTISSKHSHWLFDGLRFLNSGTAQPGNGGISLNRGCSECKAVNCFGVTGYILMSSAGGGVNDSIVDSCWLNGANVGGSGTVSAAISVGGYALFNTIENISNSGTPFDLISSTFAFGNQLNNNTFTIVGTVNTIIHAVIASVAAIGNVITTFTMPNFPGTFTGEVIGVLTATGANNVVTGLLGSGTGGTVTAVGIAGNSLAPAIFTGNYVNGCLEGISFSDVGSCTQCIAVGNYLVSQSDTSIRHISVPAGADILVADNVFENTSGESVLLTGSTVTARAVVSNNVSDNCFNANGSFGLYFVSGLTEAYITDNKVLNVNSGNVNTVIGISGASIAGRIKGNTISATAIPGTSKALIVSDTSPVLVSDNMLQVGGVTAWTNTLTGANVKSAANNWTLTGTTWASF